MKRESYIDIPRANLTQGLYINVSSSYPVLNVDDVKFDPNFGIDLSYNNFGAALKWYDGVDFAVDLSYQILSDKDGGLSLAIGIEELCLNQYISPAGAGSEEAFNDENYEDRPPEIASFYIVGTKKLAKSFEITVGLGRGKFVGYGPRSFVPNTDLFFEEKHKNWAVGVFGGTRIILPNNLAFILEIDGRDANFGMEYQNDLVKGTLALNKLELFAAGEGSEVSPRVSLNLSYKLMSFKEKTEEKKKEIPVAIKLIDKDSREPIKGHTITIDKMGDTVNISAFKSIHSFSLEPGIYTLRIMATDYIDKTIKMGVKGVETQNQYTIELSKKETPKKAIKTEIPARAAGDFENIKKTIDGMIIKFPSKNYELTVRAYSILDTIVELISDDENINIIVIGHTCSLGKEEDNQVLSEFRAEKVKEYMIWCGISPGRIRTEAYGETKPIAPNSTEESRRKNRRVEFILYKNE